MSLVYQAAYGHITLALVQLLRMVVIWICLSATDGSQTLTAAFIGRDGLYLDIVHLCPLVG